MLHYFRGQVKMSNFNKFCLLFIVGMVYANTATAVDVSALTKDWGNGVLNTCGTHSLGLTDCIGISAKDDTITNPGGTISWDCNTDKNMGIYSRHTAHDERAILMMVARQIKGKCAYFCPTQIEARNQNKKSPWIEYVDASTNQNIQCVWLCQDGDWSETSFKPDVTELSWETYKDIKSVTQGSTIENSEVVSFGNTDSVCDSDNTCTNIKPVTHGSTKNKSSINAYYRECNKNLKQEHNMFLSIDSITESKHGAYVKQMVVRANYSGYEDMYSWPVVYPASNAQKILVCKIGYKPDDQRTDCVEVSKTADAKQQMTESCDDDEQYDERIHKCFYNEKTEKYEYHCKEAGYGFSPKAPTCEKCINNPIHDGINPENGECVKCPDKKAFDKENETDSYCSDMKQVDKTTLQYGTAKGGKFTDQCWTKDSSDYADCVKPALP